MKIKGTAILLLFSSALLLCAAQGSPSSDASASRSVWDGVFTEEQSKRGEALYKKECSNCHGDTLKGRVEAPALAGGTFISNWNGLPLGDLFERIRRTMPQDDPSRVTRQEKVDVLAYLLFFNKFPAGKAELQRQPELLKQIRFEAGKPDAKQ